MTDFIQKTLAKFDEKFVFNGRWAKKATNITETVEADGTYGDDNVFYVLTDEYTPEDVKSFLAQAIKDARQEERKKIARWMSFEYGGDEDFYNELLSKI